MIETDGHQRAAGRVGQLNEEGITDDPARGQACSAIQRELSDLELLGKTFQMPDPFTSGLANAFCESSVPPSSQRGGRWRQAAGRSTTC